MAEANHIIPEEMEKKRWERYAEEFYCTPFWRVLHVQLIQAPIKADPRNIAEFLIKQQMRF